MCRDCIGFYCVSMKMETIEVCTSHHYEIGNMRVHIKSHKVARPILHSVVKNKQTGVLCIHMLHSVTLHITCHISHYIFGLESVLHIVYPTYITS